MSNIAGLFHPWEREPERGGWLTGVEAGGGWKRERAAREGATEGGAPIHQRPSTLAFPPLSFFSTVRAPSFRVTSALFRPPFLPASSASETELLYPPRAVSAAVRAGRCFPTPKTSLPACATDCSFRIHYRGPCQRFAGVYVLDYCIRSRSMQIRAVTRPVSMTISRSVLRIVRDESEIRCEIFVPSERSRRNDVNAINEN